MDLNFANMRVLMQVEIRQYKLHYRDCGLWQVLDQPLYDTIQQAGDFSHFYFCYRWSVQHISYYRTEGIKLWMNVQYLEQRPSCLDMNADLTAVSVT